ncbi:HK97-gp10 family putative phage morphogenesis protein [Helcococcus bovis]|uniref:HK97-gp10 family putative phage morphogenesis protein n=1 Tax=Helcococcus bovis TaxID=3153252 RepID=UPI0038BA1C14
MTKVNIKGLNKLNKKLDKLKDLGIKRVIEDATARVRDEARKNAPVDTGALAQSIRYRSEKKNKSNYRGIVYTNNEYSSYVEFGTGPVGQANHQGISPEVKPRYSPKGWKYFDEKQEKWIYTKGQKAQPFMYPALKDNEKKIKKFISRELKKEIKGVIK